MAFKDILLTLTSYPEPTPVSVVGDAVSIAAALGAHLAAVSCEVHVQVPGNILSGSIPNISGIIAGEAEKSRNSARNLLAAFDAAAEKAGVPRETIVEKCLTFEVPDLLVDYARLRDLTIVPVPESYDQWYAETVIFGSGRPTLILPQTPRARPFELGTVVVAWDFSRAAARAVSDALPLLERAKKVRVVTVTNEKSSRYQTFSRGTGEEPRAPRHRRGAGQGRRRRQADRRGSRNLRAFAAGRRARDGRLWSLPDGANSSWAAQPRACCPGRRSRSCSRTDDHKRCRRGAPWRSNGRRHEQEQIPSATEGSPRQPGYRTGKRGRDLTPLQRLATRCLSRIQPGRVAGWLESPARDAANHGRRRVGRPR